MIPVTKTFLPPIEEYTAQVQRAYNNHWLTNRGELVKELEHKLKQYLEVTNIIITNNGTVPLQIALKLLGKGAEIITTPFSYVATTASIVWENCTPVFVDIHPEYLTIDETKIEAAITEKTTCILATHVFGNPCNVGAIESIAAKHNLKVIYDAAHCFGVKYKGKSIFEYGDVSTCSFHATKLFHTAEGGAMFCRDEELNNRMYYTHNFGHKYPYGFLGLGINAKISELQAAMGLATLPYIDEIKRAREKVIQYYQDGIKNKDLLAFKIRPETKWNFSYFPIIVPQDKDIKDLELIMNRSDIMPRRYFYPSLNTLSFVHKSTMSISENISQRILCLPLYHGLSNKEQDKVISLINRY